ncbi:MAG: hypothetical protein KDI82_02980 [Gammaproteobacteria bacterium]|nr:hypothetical protein [Gammaproteobacteria bacterium]
MIKTRLFSAEAVAAIALFTLAQASSAFTIDSATTAVGDTFDVAWELSGTDNPTGVDLSGNATFEVLAISSGSAELQFGLTLTNTTPVDSAGGFSNIALSSFGFGVNASVPGWAISSWGPTGSGGGQTSGSGGGPGTGPSNNGDIDFFGAIDPSNPSSDPSFPAGAPNLNDPMLACTPSADDPDQLDCVEVVAVAVGGPGDPGIGANGGSDSFEFTLTLDDVLTPGTQLTVNPFAASYTYDDTNDVRAQVVVGANEIPLPGSLLLLAIGGLAMRRFSRRA